MDHQHLTRPVCLEERSKRIIRLLGKSNVLEIIWHLVNADQPLRFNELRRHVDVTATSEQAAAVATMATMTSEDGARRCAR